ncbi:MAG: UvrD-helicase domain-containing protein [Acidobacteria bacterium]|nr:UvrD-helicase domain-containing protein [Acidobacteriota bacterium]
MASLPRPVGRQREVLYLPARGHTVVLGTAGSGKTALAILRSLYLSDPSTGHAGRTLLVTFNRCLVTYMEHLAGATRQPIDVRNYHHFARGYLNSRGKLPRNSICAPDERLRFVESAVSEARVVGAQGAMLRRPTKLLDEEFQWIQRRGVTTAEDYIDAERTGRSTRVTRADRADVFDLYQRYVERRARAGKLYDWDDLASAVHRELGDDENARLYRHVVIDEGQDFSPEMLRSLAAAIPGDGSLTFFGDIAQQIYGHRMSWRSAGLNASRIWRFQENYRNTKQIARLALALAAMPHFPDDPDLVEPTAPAADGPLPVLAHQPSESAERGLVVSRATDLAQTGTVAVLFRTREQEKDARRHLPRGATRLHRNLNVWPTGPGLFYGTYHASKGLEFDTVFMPFLSAQRWPHPPDVKTLGREEAAVRDSRLLYVGITRARSTLVLTHTGQPTALLPTTAELYRS